MLAERDSGSVFFDAGGVVDSSSLAGGDGIADFGPGHVLDQERLGLGEERGGENQCGEAEFHRRSIAYSGGRGMVTRRRRMIARSQQWTGTCIELRGPFNMFNSVNSVSACAVAYRHRF